MATFTAPVNGKPTSPVRTAPAAPAATPAASATVMIGGQSVSVDVLLAQIAAQQEEILRLQAQNAGPSYPQYRIAAEGETTKSGEARRSTTVYATFAAGTRDVGHTSRVWTRIIANAVSMARDMVADPATFGADAADVAALQTFLSSVK